MQMPGKKYPGRRKKAFERMVGKLLAKTGGDFRGDTRRSILQELEGCELRAPTKWGETELPGMLPTIRAERWSTEGVLRWYAFYRKREERERESLIDLLVEYIVLVRDVPLEGVEDVPRALEAVRDDSSPVPVLRSSPDMEDMDAGKALQRFQELTEGEKEDVLERANSDIKGKDREMMEELEEAGRLGQITCECCEEVVACPTCTNDRLRGWETEKGTVALCYECGTLFVCDTGEVLSQFEGPKDTWGAKALSNIASMG